MVASEKVPKTHAKRGVTIFINSFDPAVQPLNRKEVPLAETTTHLTHIDTLEQFYYLMRDTVTPRRRLVSACLEQASPAPADIDVLRTALHLLEQMPGEPTDAQVAIDERTSTTIDIDYEINELRKDLLFLERGEQAFTAHLYETAPGMRSQVEACVSALADVPLHAFVTDRDGTVNNYCGRYLSSIQSVYNAVFLTRFARGRIDDPIILTSAPLEHDGLVDISVGPPGVYILAGSKGREFRDRRGQRHAYPIDPTQQQALDQFNSGLLELLKQPRYRRFSLIGSGFQRKFGQTTVARQDISHSVSDEDSQAFLGTVRGLVADIDASGTIFRIEDTGKDIEIILTVAHEDRAGTSEFDKGDGVAFLDKELGLGIDSAPVLICGDTSSDVPMATHCRQHNEATWTVFVTTDESLRERVRETGARSLFVDRPDTLVLALNELALQTQ